MRFLTLVLCLLFAGSAAAQPAERRFALVVGNDLGGEGTETLLYAREDARRMHEALIRLGGVRPEDAVAVLGRNKDAVLAAMQTLEARLRDAARNRMRTAFVFYYSGHAKDGFLRLGESNLALQEIKRRMDQSPADVRLAIVDSCRSGAVTRNKGALRGPAFDIETTGAAGNPGDNARGTVFLTSSSFDEDSQESDHIGGSYFSYHLIGAMQGAADQSNDGYVTLSEAYTYTYARTVADTAGSSAGAQHPTFSYDLKGNGEFVLAHYVARKEGLYLPAKAPAGAYFLVDSRGVVAAETQKIPDRDKRIAIAPGQYTVKRRLPDRLRIGRVNIAQGQLLTLNESALHDVPFSDDPVKGVYRDVSSRYSLSLGAGAQSFFDQPTRSGLFPTAGMVTAEFLVADFLRHNFLVGFDIGSGSGSGVANADTVTASFQMSQLVIGTSLVKSWPLFDGDVVPFFGLRLAFLFMSRDFDNPELPEQYFSTFSPGLTTGLRYRLTRDLGLIGRARVHYLQYNVGVDQSLGFHELSAALSYDF